MDQEIIDALRKPSDFFYHGANEEMFVTWGLCGPSLTRDSDKLDESNYYIILNVLESEYPNDYQIVSSSHWLVGWVDQIAIRVLDEDDEPTEVFGVIKDFSNQLQDYPVLDEEDYNRREYEEAIDTIEFIAPAFEFTHKGISYEVKDELPEDWANQVYSFLFDSSSICTSEEYSNDDIEWAFVALGYAKEV